MNNHLILVSSTSLRQRFLQNLFHILGKYDLHAFCDLIFKFFHIRLIY